LAGYLKENQRAYFDGLGQVQLQEKWTEWVSFFATSVTVAANESMQTANRLLAVLERWKRVLAEVGFRSDAAISKLPEVLIGRPVVTTIQVKEMLDVSFPAASNALSKLEELGILQRPTQAQRNRVFVAGEVIDVLNRPVSDVSN
jgi:Fic family protein